MVDRTSIPAVDSPRPNRAERIAKAGTLISAILASSCCWLPLLFLAAGVSGAGIVSTLGAYRMPFMVVTFAFLGAAFYFTYRPRRATAAQTESASSAAAGAVDCCAPPAAPVADCCAPPQAAGAAGASTGRRRFSMMALNKVMLWIVTILAVAFLFFPKYFTAMLADEGEFTPEMSRSVLEVEGMTCEGCVPPVAKAIRTAPGVLAVKVDYPSGLATVGTAPGDPVPRQEIVASLEAAGFSGKFTEP